MTIFLIMMVIGYLTAKREILTEPVSKAISWIIVNIANPALILSGSTENSISRSKLVYVLAVAFIVYFIMIAVAEFVIPLFHFGRENAGLYKALFVFTNMGFMGFPIMSAMYGTKAVLYGAMFSLPFSFLIYTYGILRIIGKAESFKTVIRKCMNAGVMAVLITLVLVIFNIKLPYIITQSANMLGNLIAPLCMMVIGATFTQMPFKQLIADKKVLLFSPFRLIIVPYGFMYLVSFMTKDILLMQVTFIVIATPAGSMTPMLAQQYGGDYLTASKVVAITTILSVVTMPILFMILKIG